ncbi:NAD(P)-dependent oxidoreductase [Zavarzinia sp. CC-PAN008]|uniref:NAD(P)-dependent oxidoreductase n=1 Tax=Zavarzinia sp. CC-PAN008 TaxID=3243332 RepID=UPI003F74695C
MRALLIDGDPFWASVQDPDDPPIDVNESPFGEADIPRLLAGYQIVVVDHTWFSRETLKACPDLKHFVFLGTGAASFVDMAAAQDLGITVWTIPGYGNRAVAEQTIALMFAAARGLAQMDREVRRGTWSPAAGVQLEGKVLGLVGLGGIGRETARIARGLGMEVIAWNRSATTDPNARMASLDTVLSTADVLSIHLLLTAETENFLTKEHFARLKKGVLFVNTARAAVVQEQALLDALADGTIGAAGLDVFHKEPLPQDDPITRFENVVIASHSGWRTPDAAINLIRLSRQRVKALQAGTD